MMDILIGAAIIAQILGGALAVVAGVVVLIWVIRTPVRK